MKEYNPLGPNPTAVGQAVMLPLGAETARSPLMQQSPASLLSLLQSQRRLGVLLSASTKGRSCHCPGSLSDKAEQTR